MQISENAVRFHGGRLGPDRRGEAAVARDSHVPTSRCTSTTSPTRRSPTRRPTAGFSSLMFDAGALPYADNVARTARAARQAHDAGLWVEAELGYVGGKPDAPQSAHAEGVRTDPDEARTTSRDTGGRRARRRGRQLARDDRRARRGSTPNWSCGCEHRLAVPLVLHGSSGVPDDELRAAVAAGIAQGQRRHRTQHRDDRRRPRRARRRPRTRRSPQVPRPGPRRDGGRGRPRVGSHAMTELTKSDAEVGTAGRFHRSIGAAVGHVDQHDADVRHRAVHHDPDHGRDDGRTAGDPRLDRRRRPRADRRPRVRRTRRGDARAGGTYIYLREAFQYRTGKLMPFLFAWTALISIPLIMSTGAIGIVQYLGFYFPS